MKKGVCYDKEITVKTAKGEEFKFCGISDTFTRYHEKHFHSYGLKKPGIKFANVNTSPTKNFKFNKYAIGES